jgi:hypothetical protein
MCQSPEARVEAILGKMIKILISKGRDRVIKRAEMQDKSKVKNKDLEVNLEMDFSLENSKNPIKSKLWTHTKRKL